MWSGLLNYNYNLRKKIKDGGKKQLCWRDKM